ncbi:MaoC family dehydratase [Propioniciclava coleopterorum]|uniref:MaoC family dehydratase n=1 Tax=Propioniciclava coleopterorum TaxID=2714937 RepID=UPI0019800CDD|nr:MaoC/PaaZ C-terminal domain-containing protein [Propioniciclava coleopterorum]
MSQYPEVGARARFAKTVTETDVTLFAGITGDLAPQHTNAAYMAAHPVGQRVAHGVLTLGVASTASSALCAEHGVTALSYGYDKVRFLAPVFLGDTVSVELTVARIEPARSIAVADVRVTNQRGDLILVAEHLLYCYEETR